MTPLVRPDRCCPRCQSDSYLFRARRTAEGEAGRVIQTKYRCRGCSNEWWESVPAPPEKRPEGESAA